MKRNERGITLIALVVTIVVLLILAGVSISMLTGENGIITQASNAKDKTGKANAEEQVQMAVFAQISQYLQNNVLTEGNTGAEGLVDDIVVAVGDKSSKLCTSLPEGYVVSNATEVYGEPTKATFTVIADGTTYKATFDGVTQSTTVVAE